MKHFISEDNLYLHISIVSPSNFSRKKEKNTSGENFSLYHLAVIQFPETVKCEGQKILGFVLIHGQQVTVVKIHIYLLKP